MFRALLRVILNADCIGLRVGEVGGLGFVGFGPA